MSNLDEPLDATVPRRSPRILGFSKGLQPANDMVVFVD